MMNNSPFAKLCENGEKLITEKNFSVKSQSLKLFTKA